MPTAVTTGLILLHQLLLTGLAMHHCRLYSHSDFLQPQLGLSVVAVFTVGQCQTLPSQTWQWYGLACSARLLH
jgi:hypothetical protein